MHRSRKLGKERERKGGIEFLIVYRNHNTIRNNVVYHKHLTQEKQEAQERMQIVCICNQKGGTGKTSTAQALGQAAKSKGKKALLIDLDPQGNLTYITGAKAGGKSSLDLLHGTPAEQIAQKETSGGVDIIPASWKLQEEVTSKGSARRLSEALEGLNYDYVFIDTPAKAGELQYNALQAAHRVIIPAEVDILSLQGIYQMAATLEAFKQSNKELGEIDIIFTKCPRKTSLSKQMEKTITAKAEELDIKIVGAIPEAVAFREAQALKRSLFDYAPKSKPAAAYLEAFEAISRKPRRKK